MPMMLQSCYDPDSSTHTPPTSRPSVSLVQTSSPVPKPKPMGPGTLCASGQGARMRKAFIASGKLLGNVRVVQGMCCAARSMHVSAHVRVPLCIQTHLPPQCGLGYLLGMYPARGCTKGGWSKPILWWTEEKPHPQFEGTFTHLGHSQARGVSGWASVTQWANAGELHWSAKVIYKVAGARCVPCMRVACLPQALREGEVKQASDTRDAANEWLEAHWNPLVALQGSEKGINACSPFRSVCTCSGPRMGTYELTSPLEGRGQLMADKLKDMVFRPDHAREVLRADGDDGG